MSGLVRVNIDAREALRALETTRQDQLPYAFALSLTRTAQAVQRAEKEALPLRFTLRRAAFIQSGVRVTAATKTRFEAIVQDIHGDPNNDRSFMALQETGGHKFAHAGKRYVCIPTKYARPTPGSLIAADNRPHAIMQRGGFISGHIMYARTIIRRVGRKRFAVMGGGEAAIIPMYVLVEEARIPERYRFVQTAEDLAPRIWPGEFERAFQEAVATAK